MSDKQPEALRIAGLINGVPYTANGVTLSQCAAELRRQHALIMRLASVTETDLRLMVAAPKLLDALLTAEALLYAHGKPIDPAITAALVAAGARAA